MIPTLWLATVMWLLASMSSAPLAHHSTAAYEARTITLKNATVKALVWSNPHCVLSFEMKEDGGTITTWNVESGSPSALSRVGWNRNSLRTGDVISIELFPAKNGAHVGRLARVVFADGRELLDSVFKASPFESVQKK